MVDFGALTRDFTRATIQKQEVDGSPTRSCGLRLVQDPSATLPENPNEVRPRHVVKIRFVSQTNLPRATVPQLFAAQLIA